MEGWEKRCAMVTAREWIFSVALGVVMAERRSLNLQQQYWNKGREI